MFQYRFGRYFEWILLFVVLLAAISIITTSPTAPQLMLIIMLYVITINFSVPLSVGYTGLTPIVAITSLLTLDFDSALLAAAIGLPIAAIMRPFWQPLWHDTSAENIPWSQLISMGIIHFIALSLTGLTHRVGEDGLTALTRFIARIPNTTVNIFVPLLLTLIFVTIHVILIGILWLALRQSPRQYVSQAATYLLGTTFFALPLTIFIVSADIGLPAFVFLCVGIAAFAIITWTSWQRRDVMVQRLEQFASLNAIGSSLRETLDLSTVLARTHEQVAALIASDDFTIALLNQEGEWEQPVVYRRHDGRVRVSAENQLRPLQPDDLTQWVVTNNRVLDLDQDNMYHAERRNLQLPIPNPTVWMGVPMTTASRTIGAMVVQKQSDIEPFTRWEREVLLAVAGQASAAIENARLHSETVRLYNLTDEALARRLEQLQALLYSITEGVLMIDTAGKIVLINPTAAELMGQNINQLRRQQLNPTATAVALGFSLHEASTLLATLRANQHPTPNQHVYHLNKSDKVVYIERNEVPVTSTTAQLMGWLMVFRDVTEERQRAEWRADLTRMIVHDLRNPITTISSTVSLIENRLDQAAHPQVNDLLGNAQHGCANLLEMVDSLMDINRAEAGKFVVDAEAMRLSTLANRVLNYAQPLAQQRGVTLELSYPDTLPPVWGDEEILRRVLVNLIDNALKFTPAGGKVVGRLSAEPDLTNTHETGVRVTITDDGPGIAPDQRERIFDRFVTFNRGGGQVRGTGLGLTFCKLAVEAHGGKIWVEDAPDSGSAFIFTVPGIPIF